jgi:hypothetical protein
MELVNNIVVENLKATLGSLVPTWTVKGSGSLLILNEEGKAVGKLHLDEIPRVESFEAPVDPSSL